MATWSVVEDLEDIGPGHFTGFANPFPDSFLLQAAEERLRNGSVPAVATAAHAQLRVAGEAEAPEVVATVLAALTRMDDDPVCAPNDIRWPMPPKVHGTSTSWRTCGGARSGLSVPKN